MRTEIPECRRCCMCLPLRYSLIVWGYFRVLLAGIILFAASYFLDEDINRPNENLRTGNTSEIVMLSLLILVLIPDIIFGIVFIVGCHMKNAALIKKYYYHNIFLLALFIPLSLYDIGWTIDHILKIRISIAHMFLYSVLAVMTCLTYMVIQIYIVLLIRSEFIKLETNACRFRYDNGEAEAQCALNMEGLEEGQEATDAIKGVHNYDKLTNLV